MLFTKMHGCGNDYVYVDCFREAVTDAAVLAVEVSDRHFGIGSDGLILIIPSEKADCRMEMYNADGSRAAMCGNGIRCVGKYIYDHGIAKKPVVTVDTDAGVKTLKLQIEDDICVGATVNMGAPILEATEIPTTLAPNGNVINTRLELSDGKTVYVTCVSMGNPHATIVVDNPKTYPVHEVGRTIERHPAFPERVNVHFISVPAPGKITIRTWERGSGETLACGTGNCAALVAATLLGLCDGEADMTTLGGELHIKWDRAENTVYMTGPAAEVFSGEYRA